ncbi:putative small lipoprotein YifL [Duganella sp. 3397]|uniref:LPS translocon maturation chaperone LptM n=1 Tax=Duganella sp. 3397 TaxID=2817732 RepID=UPI0028592287|nr:lipoprotein [Duganella sp. 3397]MDR7048241.1 putative small lipoprotein YifL [Duganella sp. 3397]
MKSVSTSPIRYAVSPIIGAATVALTVMLSGCGQPGPLYLPKPPVSKPAKSSTVPVSPAAEPPAPIVPTPAEPIAPPSMQSPTTVPTIK